VWLGSIFRLNLIQVQTPIEASPTDRERSVPEPDLSVLADDKPEFSRRLPRGDELLLAIEIADTSAAFDLSRKALLYAAACVPEYWVLDLPRRRLVVHREPSETGYRLIRFFAEGDKVSLENRTECVRVGDLLPSQ
jgi:Uma2 family endonuclease